VINVFTSMAPSGVVAENKLFFHPHSPDSVCVLHIVNMPCGGVRSILAASIAHVFTQNAS